jgi:CDP-glucose 4,6-dehydratase
MVNPDTAVWRGRRVLVTGHTGFKGAWLALLLHRLGAMVTGIALPPEPGPNAFDLLRIAPLLAADHRADIRDGAALAGLIRTARPELVLHLAAQAFVGRGYAEPTATFATNVDGTIHVLEALRGLPGVAAAVMVTSDKVYRNDGAGRAFREGDPLGGADPYSASKAAAEIAVGSWRASFAVALPPLATARAGNVIGGGDFGAQRLIPDLVRAAAAREALNGSLGATPNAEGVTLVSAGGELWAWAAPAGRALQSACRPRSLPTTRPRPSVSGLPAALAERARSSSASSG